MNDDAPRATDAGELAEADVDADEQFDDVGDEVDEDDEDDGDPGGLAGFDLGGLFSAAQGLQAQMAAAAATIASTEVTGSSGGGAVSVTVSGTWEFRALSIDPSVIDPDDASMLEDLVLAALRDAAHQVIAATDAVNPVIGMDIGGLGGLLGGS